MKSAEFWKEKIIDLIYWSAEKYEIGQKNIDQKVIEFILEEYQMFCNYFEAANIIGKLDTFQRAACLLVAMNRVKLSYDKQTNAFIAVDAALKMCEVPYLNEGSNLDIPKKLEEIEFEKVFEDNMNIYSGFKKTLILSIMHENNVLIYRNDTPNNQRHNLEMYYFNLKTLYDIALEIKQLKEKNSSKSEEEKEHKDQITKQEIKKHYQQVEINKKTIEVEQNVTQIQKIRKMINHLNLGSIENNILIITALSMLTYITVLYVASKFSNLTKLITSIPSYLVPIPLIATALGTATILNKIVQTKAGYKKTLEELTTAKTQSEKLEQEIKWKIEKEKKIVKNQIIEKYVKKLTMMIV